jgi:hypothetical protein
MYSTPPSQMTVDVVELCGSHRLDGQRLVRLSFPELGNVVLHPDEAMLLAKALRRMVKRTQEEDF